MALSLKAPLETEMNRGPRSPLAKLEVQTVKPRRAPAIAVSLVWFLTGLIVFFNFNIVFGSRHALNHTWS